MKVGGRAGRLDSRPVSSADVEWWTAPDEGYWQALLAQGEIAPEPAPLGASHEAFHLLDLEWTADSPPVESVPDGDNGRNADRGWQRAQLALDRGELFCLKVSGANRGGLLVDWNGLQGFVPASHLKNSLRNHDPRERMSELARYIGASLTVRLIEVDPQQRRLVFSERVAASAPRSPTEVLNSLRPGDVHRGAVTNLTTFGAFVDLGGVEGLIHVSELSWDRVHHPADVLQPGQSVDVYVLGVNPGEGRIALSLKRLRPNPWKLAESHYRVGQVVEGQVTNVVSFGAFVRVEEGLEGLIHVSELAEGRFLHPRNVVREGDMVRVRVLHIDAANQRLRLSLRQARGAESLASA